MCGDASVGKSSLISMFTSKGTSFSKTYKMTGGVEVTVASVPLPESKAVVELFIFDTAGHDVFTEVVHQYWNGVYHAMLVYDTSDYQSFQNCRKWLDLLKSSRPDKERPIKGVLVGTKIDLPVQRHAVDTATAEEWAQSNGLDFLQVSAAPPGRDYDAPFLHMARTYHSSYEEKLAGYINTCKSYQTQ